MSVLVAKRTEKREGVKKDKENTRKKLSPELATMKRSTSENW